MSSNFYVNNEELLSSLLEYKKEVRKAKREKRPKPQIPRFVAECIMKIAEKRSHDPMFLRYTFREDMVADAIENCIRYGVDAFDHKRNNPFAYFSQIVFWAFLRKIKKEKKELYAKYKSTMNSGVLDEYELNSTEEGTFRQFEMYDNINEFIQKFEESRERAIAKHQLKQLEKQGTTKKKAKKRAKRAKKV
jgi:hypothetical protein